MSASEDDHACGFEAWQVLAALFQDGWTVVIDLEGVLVRQYLQNIRGNSRGASWFNQMKKNNRVYYLSGRLSTRHRRKLAALGFDNDDEMLAALASPTAPLITDDSDFLISGAKPYLEGEMKLALVGTCQALAFVKNAAATA